MNEGIVLQGQLQHVAGQRQDLHVGLRALGVTPEEAVSDRDVDVEADVGQ